MRRKNELMKIWNRAAKSWTDFVRTGKDYTRIYLNNPATFKLIGDIKGKKVLDLACGEGTNTKILAEKGAEVTGVDFSFSLICIAKEKDTEEKTGITYLVQDAANLEDISDGSFDLVTCFMSLQDIEPLDEAVKEVARILKPKGRFVFSIPHPCFERIRKNDIVIRACEDYFGNIGYEISWDMERLDKKFTTFTFHRTLEDYFRGLHKAGLNVSGLLEPKPTTEGVTKHPTYFENNLKVPQSIIIETIKLSYH